MGIFSDFAKRVSHRNGKPKVSSTLAISNGKKDATPSKVFRLSTDNDSYIDVELYSSGEFVRVLGINRFSTCAGFCMSLCQLLKLKPSHFSLMVCKTGYSTPSCRYAPPSSELNGWFNPDTVAGESSYPMFMLVDKSNLSAVLKPQLAELRTNIDTKEKCIPYNTNSVSGRQLLEQLGERVMVHLPHERKLVVRARLDHPIHKALMDVCAKRQLRPDEFFLCNPRTGDPIDPLLSFSDQHITEFELKACPSQKSNLKSLPPYTTTDYSHDTNTSSDRFSTSCLSSPPAGYAPSPRTRTMSYTVGLKSSPLPVSRPPSTIVPPACRESRALSTISCKSYKKRMAPPPPSLIDSENPVKVSSASCAPKHTNSESHLKESPDGFDTSVTLDRSISALTLPRSGRHSTKLEKPLNRSYFSEHQVGQISRISSAKLSPARPKSATSLLSISTNIPQSPSTNLEHAQWKSTSHLNDSEISQASIQVPQHAGDSFEGVRNSRTSLNCSPIVETKATSPSSSAASSPSTENTAQSVVSFMKPAATFVTEVRPKPPVAPRPSVHVLAEYSKRRQSSMVNSYPVSGDIPPPDNFVDELNTVVLRVRKTQQPLRVDGDVLS